MPTGHTRGQLQHFCTRNSYTVSVIKPFAPSHELNEYVPLLTALRAGIA